MLKKKAVNPEESVDISIDGDRKGFVSSATHFLELFPSYKPKIICHGLVVFQFSL